MAETITKYYAMDDSLLQYGQEGGETNPNATTMQDMQAYMKQNGDTLEHVVNSILWQPETDYVVGQEIHSPNIPAGYIAVCSVAGQSGEIEPTWSTTYSTFTDGTVTWNIVGSVAILSGGKVSKVITTEEEQGNIKRSVDNSYIRFSGGANSTSGAGLLLFGKSAETFGGHFMLDACTSENTTCRLEGNPNGDLTWNDKKVTCGAMPSGTKITFSLNTQESYIAPSDGYCNIVITNSPSAYIYAETSAIQMSNVSTSGTVRLFVPVKKGDYVWVDFYEHTSKNFVFIPCVSEV